MRKFPNRDFAPFGATKALRPWNPTGKVPAPGTRAGKGVPPFPPGGRLYCGQAGEYLSGTPLRSAQSLLFCRL